MIGHFEKCFALVLRDEGGFANHPKDPGGMTNLGVTRANWEAYIGHSATEADMRALTPEKVKPFYKAQFWDKVRGDDLPPGVDYAVFDFAVNSGVSRSAKFLQKAVGAVEDGVIGPETLKAVSKHSAPDLAKVICDMRIDFLRRLPTFGAFGKGWANRVAGVRSAATNMTTTA